MSNKKNITPLNTYCTHSHNINKGVNMYSSNTYKKLSSALECDFLPLENKALENYEKWLTD